MMMSNPDKVVIALALIMVVLLVLLVLLAERF
jgi:hypothetical protein